MTTHTNSVGALAAIHARGMLSRVELALAEIAPELASPRSRARLEQALAALAELEGLLSAYQQQPTPLAGSPANASQVLSDLREQFSWLLESKSIDWVGDLGKVDAWPQNETRLRRLALELVRYAYRSGEDFNFSLTASTRDQRNELTLRLIGATSSRMGEPPETLLRTAVEFGAELELRPESVAVQLAE